MRERGFLRGSRTMNRMYTNHKKIVGAESISAPDSNKII